MAPCGNPADSGGRDRLLRKSLLLSGSTPRQEATTDDQSPVEWSKDTMGNIGIYWDTVYWDILGTCGNHLLL